MSIKYMLFIFVLILSCDSGEQLFKNVEIDDEETDLYIFPEHHDEDMEKVYKSKLEKGILINDVSILREIVKSWKFTKNKFLGCPTYYVVLIKRGKPYCSMWLNADMNRVSVGDREFNFNDKKLFKYEKYFKPIIGYNVIIEDLHEAIIFKNIIETHKGYIIVGDMNSNPDWGKYSGITILRRKRFSLPIGKESEFEQIITSEFNKNFKFKINEITTNDESDSWLIKILSDSIIKVPNDYKVVKKFEKYSDISFDILELEKRKIEDLAKDNDISIKELKKVIL